MNQPPLQAVPASRRILRLLAGVATVLCAVAALVVIANQSPATSDPPHGGADETGTIRSSDATAPAPNGNDKTNGPGRVLRPSKPQAALPLTQGTPESETTQDVPEARVGRPAASASKPFAPRRMTFQQGNGAPLPAALVPVSTLPGGDLDLPAADRVGWWSGSAEAGQALGTVVLSGHVDSEAGLGYMASLLTASEGDRVTLAGEGRSQTFRVTATRRVHRAKLSQDSRWNDQGGPLKLVLITCYGRYDPVKREYLENLIITATPVP